MTLAALALAELVKARALALGFDRVAVGPPTPAHGAAFERWLAAGHAAGMQYLARGREDRLDPNRLLPGCRAAVVVALSYHAPGEAPGWAGVSRYARGRDYHEIMRPRLRALVDCLREAAGAESRAAVDTSAVLERDLAARAGLGWVGKNTNLIAPGLGSWFFIGVVLTTAPLAVDEPIADRCGRCRACLDACPTGAFVAPYELDARRCISYLTIEHRGPIAGSLQPAMGEWLFGCDVCQDVCPWNDKAAATRERELRPGLPPPSPEALQRLDDAEFRRRFRDSPLRRARREGLARNAAIVAANRARRRTAEGRAPGEEESRAGGIP